jgi:hypothetical protein
MTLFSQLLIRVALVGRLDMTLCHSSFGLQYVGYRDNLSPFGLLVLLRVLSSWHLGSQTGPSLKGSRVMPFLAFTAWRDTRDIPD